MEKIKKIKKKEERKKKLTFLFLRRKLQKKLGGIGQKKQEMSHISVYSNVHLFFFFFFSILVLTSVVDRTLIQGRLPHRFPFDSQYRGRKKKSGRKK